MGGWQGRGLSGQEGPEVWVQRGAVPRRPRLCVLTSGGQAGSRAQARVCGDRGAAGAAASGPQVQGRAIYLQLWASDKQECVSGCFIETPIKQGTRCWGGQSASWGSGLPGCSPTLTRRSRSPVHDPASCLSVPLAPSSDSQAGEAPQACSEGPQEAHPPSHRGETLGLINHSLPSGLRCTLRVFAR